MTLRAVQTPKTFKFGIRNGISDAKNGASENDSVVYQMKVDSRVKVDKIYIQLFFCVRYSISYVKKGFWCL